MSKKMDIYDELDNFVEENEGQVTLTDVAKHFAECGYQYAIDKACEWLQIRMLSENTIEQFKQFMEDLL